ncbi:MAG: EAL domain-containing protein [Betaproteobacteria bacterium]|nr:EAL domain-containing protein [Betaproteobacteria bacterium]
MTRRLLHFLFHSIRGRVIASVIVLHAVLMGLVVFDTIQRQQDFMQRQISSEGQGLAHSLAVNAEPWLLNGDISAMDEMVDGLKSLPQLQLALILDVDGKVRASTDDSLFNLLLDDEHSRWLLIDGKQQWHDNVVDSIAPIQVDGATIGHARVMLNTSGVRAELAAVARNGAIYAIVAIVLGALFAWGVVHTVTQRLARLSAAADAIAAGDLSVSLPQHEGRDEVARLTHDFNEMARALESDREQRKRFEALLFEEKERALVTLQSIGDAVITTDITGHVEFLNPIAERLTGWTTDEARGRPLIEVFHIVNEMTRIEVENPVDKALRLNGVVGLANHTLLIRRDGEEFAIEDSAAPIRDRDGKVIGVVLVFHDVTESRQMAEEIAYQASHDALTGLVNRREFEQRLNHLISNATTEQRQHALLYIDLDQFKVVNDTCGHSAGDELLRQLTLIMQDKIRGSDMLARLGGDEFGVLLENCPLDKAQHVAENLIELVKGFRFVWSDKAFVVGASIGIVAITEHSRDWASLLGNADTACYLAKEKGRNRLQVYHVEDAELAKRYSEMHWVGRINKAFEEDRFLLYHQAIVPTSRRTDELPHFEMLVRMIDEDGQLVTPSVFIPAAERYNLMGALDRWVVSNALNWVVAHKDTPMICAINLSGHSIGDEGFLRFLIDQIKGTGVQPHNLCFEITETAAIANLDKAVHFIRELKLRGCRFALDDFGAGLSSFAYLKNLPVDYLKIDGSFVKDIDRNETSYAMVEAINKIGHTMKIKTIAEFVETPIIMEKLAAIGVDFAQGFGISEPMPLGDLLEAA